MRGSKLVVVSMMLFAVQGIVLGQHHHGSSWSSSKKDPAMAAALSLQPLPMDLGGFYAGNWQRGVIYTAAEIALFVPAVVLIAENSNWGHHRYGSYYYADPNRKTWTSAERERFYYLLGGYLLIKLISALDAGYSVERQNAKLSLGYNRNSKSLGFSLAIPIR